MVLSPCPSGYKTASVAVTAPIDKLLDYAIPASLSSSVHIGTRVKVPLGRRMVWGFVLGVSTEEREGLKPIAEVPDDSPFFPPHLAAFYQRAAAYYHHPPGEVLRTALPAGITGKVQRVGVVHEKKYHALDAADQPKGARQQEILSWLRERKEAFGSEIGAVFPSPTPVLKRLVELGLVGEEEVERRRDPFFDLPVDADLRPSATEDQGQALAALQQALAAEEFAGFLLHGVTGSGKTEVYLKVIAAALEASRQALVLVPEIALTPQLVARFRARFKSGEHSIAVLHSGLSEGERYDAWRAIARGEVHIVIGARSAVFAPLDRLGVIVVDEEHEASYKQAEGFRYNARDLALMRGQMEKAVVILGSATPSLVSYHRSREGFLQYLRLHHRVLGRPLPEVELVDLAGRSMEGSLSQEMLDALESNLQVGDQSLLLLNRRGFSPYLLCRECGATFHCPNCAITLTYYQSRRLMRCNYCDYAVTPPTVCPECGGGQIEPEGAGTERLEEELTASFPEARIARMDRDTMTRKGSHQKLVSDMEQGRIDILVGTQMVAKGLDFPGVTLVGVVGADAILNLPDFRSAERAFSLLTQVAGRAGRGERPGRVLIQTYAPTHHALQHASRHDYDGFYLEEIEYRRALEYPPFGHLVNLVISGIEGEKVAEAAERFCDSLQACAGEEVEVLGPAPCPLFRLRGRTRYQILLKSVTRAPLHRLLSRLPALRSALPRTLKLTLDVDPLDML